MHRTAILLALAGCAAPGPDPAVLRARQEAACAAATAEHVGRPLEEVAATWAASGAEGGAVVEVRDGTRLHRCHVDAGLRVTALDHPPE